MSGHKYTVITSKKVNLIKIAEKTTTLCAKQGAINRLLLGCLARRIVVSQLADFAP